MRAPIRSRDPIPIPKIVGRETPAVGRDGWVGVGVDVDVPAQTQFVELGQEEFLQ